MLLSLIADPLDQVSIGTNMDPVDWIGASLMLSGSAGSGRTGNLIEGSTYNSILS